MAQTRQSRPDSKTVKARLGHREDSQGRVLALVITSREFKVAGAIGCCMSLNKKSQSVAEQVFLRVRWHR